MRPLLDADAVSVVFGGGIGGGPRKRALDDVSLMLAQGEAEIVAVVGESGSGKTTLTRLLLGLLAPTSGAVRYRGVDLAMMDDRTRREFRREVQAVFQDPFDVYNPFYRVERALRLPLLGFGIASDPADAERRIRAAIEAVGLRPAETIGRYPHQLSGGQRQRVMIARALALRPRVLVADEPVSMVDASLRATILETLRRLARENGIAIVYVTHDLTTAYQIADRIVVMKDGAIVESGDAESVIRMPRHPYTRELIAAIPIPDPETRWSEFRT